MKREFFSQFPFHTLLNLLTALCNYVPTGNEELDSYITVNRDSTTAITRTNRCVTFIDMRIVSMAITGKLVENVPHPHEMDFTKP